MTVVILGGMKTAISVPDEIFKRVDRRAKQLGVSRSEFFARAAERYLESLAEDQVTKSYDEAFSEEEKASDGFRRKATRAALLAVEWEE
jgi:predicted DNA-binding protein